MPLSSGQLSIGQINVEIGWSSSFSGKTNAYLVGTPSSSYPQYTVDSVYAWFGIDQYPVRTLISDFGNGNYTYRLCQFICEQSYHGNFPGDTTSLTTGGPWADGTTTWTYDTTYFDGFGNTVYNDNNTITTGATCNTAAMPLVICYVPGTCYVVSTSCNSVTPTYTGNNPNSPTQTTFYIGFFNNKTRGKRPGCSCT